MDRPKNIYEYTKWLRESHNCKVDEKTKMYYETMVSAVLRSFEDSTFWTQVCSKLTQWNQEYYIDTQCYLVLSLESPRVVTKPFDSFLLKTFRKKHNQ